MNNKNMYCLRTSVISVISILCMLSATLIGCQSDDESETPYGNKEKLRFQLVYQDVPQTRAGTIDAHEISYFVADKRGNILYNVQSDYHRADETIVVEPLPNGDYQLLALTFDKKLCDYGFTLSEGQQTLADTWFSFSDKPLPVISDLFAFCGKIEFTVKNQSAVTTPIVMRNVFAAVRVDMKNTNDYIRSGTKSFTLSTSQQIEMYTKFTLSGKYAGSAEWDCDDSPIEDGAILVTMPRINPEPVNLVLSLTTLDHKQLTYQNDFVASCTLQTNQLSTVSVDLSKHPDAKMGMIYASRSNYNSQARPLILQDGESKNIYYDANQRSFNINQPLQLKLSTEGVLHTRFYSPCAIKEVGIWAQLPGTTDQVQIAYYDSIPGFCDATFSLQLSDAVTEFPTSSGGRVAITKDQLPQLAKTLTIRCDDPFWIKVKQIRARWRIRFSSFQTDPDLPNGGAGMNGDWKGLRLVHAREAIAIMFNIGYMITLPEYVAWQKTFQGKLYGNGGSTDILDVNTIIPRMEAHGGFNVGLVAGGSLGLGGGETWGVWQGTFIEHYTSTSAVNTAFHEIGHCIGFGHSSSMTYGQWAGGCCDWFYVTNIKKFPVNDYRILNSRNNPNLYQ